MNTEMKCKLDTNDILFSIDTKKIQDLRGKTPEVAIFGQPRAMDALKTGLGIGAKGFNIFVMGDPGTGRRTALMSLLDNLPTTKNTTFPDDIVYVFNFNQPYSPLAHLLPAGKGKKLQQLLEETIPEIKKQILVMETSNSFTTARKKINRTYEDEQHNIVEKFEKEMQSAGFKPIQTPDNGMDLMPIIDGETISFDDLQIKVANGEMESAEWNKLRGVYYQCVDRLGEISTSMTSISKQNDKEILELRRNFSTPVIEHELEAIKSEIAIECVSVWLDGMQKDIITHLSLFTDSKRSKQQAQLMHRYEVNVLCTLPEHSKIPIVQEEMPTFVNLFGSIEQPQNAPESVETVHLRLRAGAIHRARGGYLILRLQDMVQEEGAWSYLKKILQSGKIEFQQQPGSMQPPSRFKPMPVSAELKVIILGGSQSYDLMFHEDPDFYKLFKICAEFDSSMIMTDETIGQYISFCDSYAQKRGLRTLDEQALSCVLCYGSRLAEYRNRLSTKFTLVADLLVEADYEAKKNNHTEITGNDVQNAIERHQYFVQLPEEKVLDAINCNEIIVNTMGTAVGCVNGLAVLDRGFYTFGIPVSVTACTAPGQKGVINVEGEAGLSGEIYDKALFIIQGFIRSRYLREAPLAMTASICFEQSYTGVDGDSASCAELFALMSALTGIPLRQDIAVTGSINQMGKVQPVGGVTEKIEGFYKVCKMKGLTGTQGCIIPRQNMNNLILSQSVQNSVKEGNFHIWAISTIDEGLEILSNIVAGEKAPDGTFPFGSFNEQIQNRLCEYARCVHTFNT